ncbi:N-acetylmannosamine-6-phosphate 2-epimerase [Pararhizobium mangrovi]|uniref:N-acylglucosamine-6-phosphate 2-epimerase n=1 Tax=Pararhizobium mangrovi TaxID=2590452 RepID=A0A506U025_9HYPH|nr:putative N-acetylmannosamine-6-phosphate 2-epimerase [Pararhizobium mangrovi]TPW26325.1 putative N-acetylmannosamine-6-phosphate 2-epimerase [Pararhizobium mangrovi]
MSAIPKGCLVVSCQARVDNPLHGPQFMGAMARAAAEGGAGALRVNGPEDIAAAREAGLPIIGINKIFSDHPVYITPSFEAAEAVARAGADIVALDCTHRPHPCEAPEVLVRRIREELDRPVFADISTLEEGIAAEAMGAAYVATTLAGHTGGPVPALPDLALIEALASRCTVPVVAEGRFNTPELARAAIDAGAHAVVVGTMITNPREITRAFAARVSPA